MSAAWPLVVAFTLSAAAPADEVTPADPRADPYYAEPDLRALMDWATFQLTFDRGDLIPDMAAGEYEAKPTGTPRFEPGVKGLALAAGADSARVVYPRGPNAPLAHRGAVAVWICPVNWTHDNAPNGTFLMTTNASFYIQRQGPQRNHEGRFTRHEGLQLIVRAGGKLQVVMRGTSTWPNGQWRLVIANWSWPTMSLSVDGGEFQSRTVEGEPADRDFGGLLIGASAGETTLLDELTIFRRPLTIDEARRLYRTFRPGDEE